MTEYINKTPSLMILSVHQLENKREPLSREVRKNLAEKTLHQIDDAFPGSAREGRAMTMSVGRVEPPRNDKEEPKRQSESKRVLNGFEQYISALVGEQSSQDGRQRQDGFVRQTPPPEVVSTVGVQMVTMPPAIQKVDENSMKMLLSRSV